MDGNGLLNGSDRKNGKSNGTQPEIVPMLMKEQIQKRFVQ